MNLPEKLEEFIETVRAAHDELCPMVHADPASAAQTFQLWSMAHAHSLYAAIVQTVDALSEANNEALNEARAECGAWKMEYGNEYTMRINTAEQLTDTAKLNIALSELLAAERAESAQLRIDKAHLESKLVQMIEDEATAARKREEELKIDLAHLAELIERASKATEALRDIAFVLDTNDTDHNAAIAVRHIVGRVLNSC